ncbi:MAG: universal stress protein [Pseudomonadota bacterium]
MYARIMVPVDLAHLDRLDKALATAAILAKANGSTIAYLSLVDTAPSSVAPSPEAYDRKLEAFAAAQGEKFGVETEAITIPTPDPRVEAHHRIVEATADFSTDLVVMQTRAPGVMDALWHSNGEYVANHAKCSVMLIR